MARPPRFQKKGKKKLNKKQTKNRGGPWGPPLRFANKRKNKFNQDAIQNPECNQEAMLKDMLLYLYRT